jgi:enoyl-CoA hydratase/carnithine racemase
MNKLTCFELTVERHVAHLVMNRADRMNTLDMTFWRELDNTLQQLHQGSESVAQASISAQACPWMHLAVRSAWMT